jgi:hypothetical protein
MKVNITNNKRKTLTQNFQKHLLYLKRYKTNKIETLNQLVALHKYTCDSLSKTISSQLKIDTDFIDWYFSIERTKRREMSKICEKKRKVENFLAQDTMENVTDDEDSPNVKQEPVFCQ